MNGKKLAYSLVLIVFGMAAVMGITRAWTAPTVAPPGGSAALYYSSGNVGVGRTNPQAKLDVNGVIRATDLCDETGANCKDISTGWPATTWVQNGSHVYYNTGNVGIGVSSPAASLDIGGNPGSAVRTSYLNVSANNTPYADRPYVRGTTSHLVINGGGTSSGGDLYLNYTGDGATGNVRVREMLFVTSGGVGIGTSSPAQQLHVTGNARVDGAIVAPEGTLRDDGGGWVRTYGNTGWYSQTYGGGWYMTDTTWLRAYGDKSVYTGGGIIRSDASVRAPIFYDQNDTGYYVDPNGNSRLHDVVADYYESGTIDQGDCYHRTQNHSNGEFRCADGYYMAGLQEDGDGMDNIYCCHP